MLTGLKSDFLVLMWLDIEGQSIMGLLGLCKSIIRMHSDVIYDSVGRGRSVLRATTLQSAGCTSCYKVNESRKKPLGLKLHSCNICEMKFQHMKCLEKHLLKHMVSRSRTCPFCGRKFSDVRTVFNHMLVKHLYAKKYSCSDCSRKFDNEENLKKHLEKHRRMNQFNCRYCRLKFYKLCHLRRHLRVHAMKKKLFEHTIAVDLTREFEKINVHAC